MQVNMSSFGRNADCRDVCGNLRMKADVVGEAEFLAAFSNYCFNPGVLTKEQKTNLKKWAKDMIAFCNRKEKKIAKVKA